MYCEHCGQHCGPDDCPKFINYEAWKFLTDWLHPWHLVLSVVALVVLFGSEESQSMFADSFLADDGPSLLAFGLFGILAVSFFTLLAGAVFWPLRGAIHLGIWWWRWIRMDDWDDENGRPGTENKFRW